MSRAVVYKRTDEDPEMVRIKGPGEHAYRKYAITLAAAQDTAHAYEAELVEAQPEQCGGSVEGR